MVKYVVTGATGQLGLEIVRLLWQAVPGSQVLTPRRESLDLLVPESITSYLERAAPDVIINCAAWTAVDDAEREPESAWTVNVDSPRAMAEYCSAAGAFMLQVSTDYVFRGTSAVGYTESDPIAPESVYGRSKAEAEMTIARLLPDRHAVVRTAWLYGRSYTNFAAKVLMRLREEEFVQVVDDQMGSPTWCRDVGGRIVDLLPRSRADFQPVGTIHAVNSGSASWFEFAQALVKLSGLDTARVLPISTSSLGLAAPRPAYSQLLDTRCSKEFGLPPLRPWGDALRAAIPELARFGLGS